MCARDVRDEIALHADDLVIFYYIISYAVAEVTKAPMCDAPSSQKFLGSKPADARKNIQNDPTHAAITHGCGHQKTHLLSVYFRGVTVPR